MKRKEQGKGSKQKVKVASARLNRLLWEWARHKDEYERYMEEQHLNSIHTMLEQALPKIRSRLLDMKGKGTGKVLYAILEVPTLDISGGQKSPETDVQRYVVLKSIDKTELQALRDEATKSTGQMSSLKIKLDKSHTLDVGILETSSQKIKILDERALCVWIVGPKPK